ncbi:hypothetical protein TcWFU_002846 [Taenia crassiceps]|uniref:Uncharacterized protein n=1 Tax=Taenia crassiceps TaxID=6207 RepID=A0ABR4QAW3_9CEST
MRVTTLRPFKWGPPTWQRDATHLGLQVGLKRKEGQHDTSYVCKYEIVTLRYTKETTGGRCNERLIKHADKITGEGRKHIRYRGVQAGGPTDTLLLKHTRQTRKQHPTPPTRESFKLSSEDVNWPKCEEGRCRSNQLP